MKQPIPFANCHECLAYRPCAHCDDPDCGHPDYPELYQCDVTGEGIPEHCPLPDANNDACCDKCGKPANYPEHGFCRCHLQVEIPKPTPFPYGPPCGSNITKAE